MIDEPTVEPMGLDELVAEIEDAAVVSHATDDECIWGVIKMIKDNRDRLEAGMRQPLRFAKVDAHWWLVKADDPTMRVVFRNADDELLFCKHLTKISAIRFADDLGLTAEFIDDPTNPQNGSGDSSGS